MGTDRAGPQEKGKGNTGCQIKMCLQSPEMHLDSLVFRNLPLPPVSSLTLEVSKVFKLKTEVLGDFP